MITSAFSYVSPSEKWTHSSFVCVILSKRKCQRWPISCICLLCYAGFWIFYYFALSKCARKLLWPMCWWTWFESFDFSLPHTKSDIPASLRLAPCWSACYIFAIVEIENSQCSIRGVVSSPDFLHRQQMLDPAEPLIRIFGQVSNALLLISHMSILAFVGQLEFQMNLACSNLSPLAMIRL